MNPKALIAMSGGVDSAVAVYLMQKQGYDCIGATMKLFHNEDIGENIGKTCCSLTDVEDARRVAATLGIPHYVFNFTREFTERVIGKFIEVYEAGATPNPCIDCNRYLKFEKFLLRAQEIGIDMMATGHYARIAHDKGSNRYLLQKAADDSKDQSYVLYAMTQNQLKHTAFPLGALRKSEVRAIAAREGFVNAQKRDSQDICFVPNGNYAAFIAQYTGRSCVAGDFVDANGNILGKHNGILRYTIGQRKGLGLALNQPMYVCAKCARSNTVTLGRHERLFTRAFDANDFNWIACDKPDKPLRVKAKVRYSQDEQSAVAEVVADDLVHIEFDTPQRAIAKGQAVVLYDGDVVVGGGTIM